MERRTYMLARQFMNVFVLFNLLVSLSSAECLKRMSTLQIVPPSFKTRILRIVLSTVLGMVTGLVFAILFALLVRYFVKYISTSRPVVKGLVVFSPKISPTILKSALSNEPQLIGSSAVGKYYKTVLDNGLTVAVKTIDLFGNGFYPAVIRRMREEFEMLSGLRHRNLMSLRAYVCESGGCSLVYDYVPTGSLEDVMRRVRGNRCELKWELRLRIAVGIVRGLHYLHFCCDPRRLHCNLKPSNVILDSEYEPRLGDCGLAAIVPNVCRAASGYIAPECFQTGRFTDKSDVYSFGVILAVLLTGKEPTDPLFGEWIRQVESIREELDKSIMGEETEEEEMVMAFRIAVVCVSELPGDRPSSDELVSMLTQLNSL